MTKPLAPRPMPTPGGRYDTYMWPRSMTPEKDALYLFLHDLAWRYDAVTGRFFTPLSSPLEGSGALEYAADFSWARIQPPSVTDHTLVPPLRRAEPLITFALSDTNDWYVTRPLITSKES